MRHQVHDIFFKVGAGATDNMHFILADHFGKLKSQFSRTHRPGKRDHHFSTFEQMCFISFCCIHQCRSIKMAVMMLDKLETGPLFMSLIMAAKLMQLDFSNCIKHSNCDICGTDYSLIFLRLNSFQLLKPSVL